MLTLLFSWNYQPLGELVFTEGRLSQVSLSALGEESIGVEVADWQVRGIPLQADHLIARPTSQGDRSEEVRAQRSVGLTSDEAEWAFFCWAAEKGHIAVKLPERLFEHWHALCRLSLEPEERFASLQALLTADHEVLMAWEKAINKLVSEVSV